MNKKLKIFIVIGLLLMLTVTIYLTGKDSNMKKFSFATAGTGGTYYPMGGGVSTLFNNKFDNIQVTPQTSGGSSENLRLLENGEVEMAWANGSELYWAWNGENIYSEKHEKLRIVAFAWTNTYHFASLKNSNIETPIDFIGKKVGVGPQGSGASVFATTFLKHVNLWNDITPMYLPPTDQSTSIKDGNIDVFGYFSGIPMSTMIDISSVKDINLIDLQTIGEEKGFTDAYPFYLETTIPSNTYNGQHEDIGTYSNLTYWVVTSDISEEVIYELVKELFSEEGLTYMKGVHQRSNELSIDNILKGVDKLGVPLHPGTIKFLEENNIKIK